MASFARETTEDGAHDLLVLSLPTVGDRRASTLRLLVECVHAGPASNNTLCDSAKQRGATLAFLLRGLSHKRHAKIAYWQQVAHQLTGGHAIALQARAHIALDTAESALVHDPSGEDATVVGQRLFMPYDPQMTTGSGPSAIQPQNGDVYCHLWLAPLLLAYDPELLDSIAQAADPSAEWHRLFHCSIIDESSGGSGASGGGACPLAQLGSVIDQCYSAAVTRGHLSQRYSIGACRLALDMAEYAVACGQANLASISAERQLAQAPLPAPLNVVAIARAAAPPAVGTRSVATPGSPSGGAVARNRRMPSVAATGNDMDIDSKAGTGAGAVPASALRDQPSSVQDDESML